MGHPGEPSALRGKPGVSTSSSSRPEGLSRKQRVTQTSMFREAYAQGQKSVGRYMVLWLRKGEGASLRLGVVASRKVGNAVCRARAKRRIRECYRRCRSDFVGDYDVIIIARRAILTAPWVEVMQDLKSLAARAGLVPSEEGCA